MSRINTNVNALISQRILGQQNNQLSKSLERLSTGFAINRGADNPAGLIASENLRSEKTAISAAISNAERADQFLNVAEGGLQEVSSMLIELQGLIGESANTAGLSQEEKVANQQQVDSILQTIDRIASQTSFQGAKMLNGNFEFNVANQSAGVVDVKIHTATTGSGGVPVQAVITASAQQAGLFLSVGGTSLDLASSDSTFSFNLAGAQGSRQFSFGSGTTTSAMAAQINAFKSVTGISAAVSGGGITFHSTDYGSDAFVSLDVVDHGSQAGAIRQLESDNAFAASSTGAVALNAATTAIRDEGQDVTAIVNGQVARSSGRNLSINSDQLAFDLTLSVSASQSIGKSDLFTVTGGGATFNLGPQVNVGNRVSLGIQNVSSNRLGGSDIQGDTGATLRAVLSDLGSGKSLNLVDGNLDGAQKVVNAAIGQVSSLRGRIGSMQSNVIGSTINSLNVAYENISAAESAIRDTDFAKETAQLTRSQILVAAASNTLAIAKNQPQGVLSLLG